MNMSGEPQTFGPNRRPDGWRSDASPAFHMLILSPSSSSSKTALAKIPDDMLRIEHLAVGNDTSTIGMSSSNASDSDEDAWVTRWVTLLGIWQAVVAFIGTPLNLWILYIWYRYGRVGSHNRFRTSRQMNNHWFVASMTFADLVSTSFHSPALVAWYFFEVKYQAQFCRSLVAIAHTASTASSLSLLCLNIDKFLYVTFSLKYELYVTKNRAIAASVTAWILSIGWALILVMYFIDNVDDGCSYMEVETNSYIIFSVGFFILPTLLSLIISIHITVIIWRFMGTAKRSDVMLQHRATSPTRIREPSVCHKSKCRPLKRVAFIFTTTAWTAATCLPYKCVFMLRKVWFLHPNSPLRYIFYGVMSANAAGNPIITLFTLRLYRSCTVRFFKKCVTRPATAS